MNVVVRLSKAELAEMDATEEQLKQGVTAALDGGLEDGDGIVYLSNFEVTVQVVD